VNGTVVLVVAGVTAGDSACEPSGNLASGGPAGARRLTVLPVAQRSSAPFGSGRLSRLPSSSGTTVAHSSPPGWTRLTQACQVTIRAALSPDRTVTWHDVAVSRPGSGCSPPPCTTYSASSCQMIQAAIGRSSGTASHARAALRMASATSGWTGGGADAAGSVMSGILPLTGRGGGDGGAGVAMGVGGVRPGTVLVLAIGVSAISASGPLMVAIAAPALAIAFWRNALASAVLVPVTLVSARSGAGGRAAALRGLDRRTLGFCVAAGIVLAAHFATWVPSVTLTSVATSTALVCTAPVWTALYAARTGARIGRWAWIGIAVAVVGAALATGADFAVSGRAVLGDVLALLGGVFAAMYVTLGERVRATVSTTLYTTVCYSVCALTLLVVCLVGGVRLGGYDTRSWLLLAAVTIGPQFLGHSTLNWVLDHLSATVVSVVTLLEVPGAALLALVFLGQRPPLWALPGLALLLAGVAVVLVDMRSAQPQAAEL